MSEVTSLIVVFAIILVSMMLHELAHGVAAYKLGDNTAKDEGRLTLNPLKHLDPFLSIIMPLFLFISGGPIFGGAKPVPVDTRNLKHGAWGMALVGIAGPLMNFLIAFICFLVGHFTGLLYHAGFWGMVFQNVVLINLGFGVFNLIPIPPLDGSRVVYAIAPDPIREVMQKMENFGILIVTLLVIAVPSVVNGIMNGAVNGILDSFYFIVNLF